MAKSLDIKREDLRSYRGGSRFYTWEGDERFGSVTSLIDGGLPKPALPRWAAKLTAQSAVDQHEVIASLIASGDKQAAVDMLKGAPWRSSGSAADSGTRVHEFLELLAQGRPKDAEAHANSLVIGERAKCAHIAAFMSEVDMEVLHVEAVMFSREYHYAGTVDLIVNLTDERLLDKLGMEGPAPAIIDLKTGKGVYDSAALQLAAYTRTDFIAGDGGEELPVPDIDYGAVLHVTEEGWAFIPMDISDRTFLAFLDAAGVAVWAKEVGRKAVGKPVARGGAELG